MKPRDSSRRSGMLLTPPTVPPSAEAVTPERTSYNYLLVGDKEDMRPRIIKFGGRV